MKVVVVLAQPPLPEGSAQGRCAVALLRGLVAHGVDVQAIAARWRTGDLDPPADLPVEVHHVRSPSSLGATVRNLWHPRAVLAGGEFGARVREMAAGADVLHLEEVHTGWCGDGATPSLLHVHCLFRRDQDLPRPWQPGFLGGLEHVRADRLVARRHDVLLASSPVVAADLREIAPRARVAEAPLSLDPVYYPVASLDGPPVAGIIGTAAWPPTRTAMRRAVTDVWPLVRSRVPGAVLRVAGRGTSTLGLSGPGVEVVGEVESASAFLRGLSVLLYPVPRGSGMKVKVLESLASGLPVVTTAHGAEGIDGGAGIVVAATDGELADHTARLLGDGDERRERGREARRAFEARYTPAAATEPLVRAYEAITGGAGAVGATVETGSETAGSV